MSIPGLLNKFQTLFKLNDFKATFLKRHDLGHQMTVCCANSFSRGIISKILKVRLTAKRIWDWEFISDVEHFLISKERSYVQKINFKLRAVIDGALWWLEAWKYLVSYQINTMYVFSRNEGNFFVIKLRNYPAKYGSTY